MLVRRWLYWKILKYLTEKWAKNRDKFGFSARLSPVCTSSEKSCVLYLFSTAPQKSPQTSLFYCRKRCPPNSPYSIGIGYGSPVRRSCPKFCIIIYSFYYSESLETRTTMRFEGNFIYSGIYSRFYSLRRVRGRVERRKRGWCPFGGSVDVLLSRLVGYFKRLHHWRLGSIRLSSLQFRNRNGHTLLPRSRFPQRCDRIELCLRILR